MIHRRHLTLAAAGAALPFWARASTYPSQPVRAIVSNAPGTGTDITARFIANQMSKKWNAPVNKAGAGGALGTDFVAKARPTAIPSDFAGGKAQR